MENSPSSLTLSPSENPNPEVIPDPSRGSRSTLHIGGLPVEFPYKPYGTQLSFMNRVISTLDRGQREGHCHALLESPTGTGKSLSLLCSTIAWQQNQKAKNLRDGLTHSSSRANPEAVTDPMNHGGGFIPETQPSGNPVAPQQVPTNPKREKKKLAPTIFYSTRTHGQISQVVREYKKTSYRATMAILGSRKHYCTNTYVQGGESIDEQCKLLLKNKENTCPEFKNAHKVKGHPSLQKGGCHEVHDIEDLVKIGQVVKGCSYFASRSMAQEAELVFCPYNYIINPIIRDAMEVDISQSIIIFDEAHNIEDMARDAGSIDLDEEALLHLQTELGQLSINDDMAYQPLFEMTQDILSWISRRKDNLVKREFQSYFRCWTGDKAVKEFQEANISPQSFSILQQCAKKAIKAATEDEPDIAHLSGLAATTLEGLFSSLNYFFSENGIHVCDYELALQRFVKKDEGRWATTLSLWCLNPSVVFKGIAELSQSVILTSGTLSPLDTFSSELGVQFGTCLEAPHVIDVDSQVWTAAIAKGPGNYPLNSSYKTSDEYKYQDAVGTTLEEICKVVPGGCLVFFPSYKLLDKLSSRWQETGQWAQLNAQKSVFVEPRRQDSFEVFLKKYYASIHNGTRKAARKPRGKKLGLKNGNVVERAKDNKNGGAALLAVCRGKVSEGMDFSDDNARAVVIVGIPFPNVYEIKVAEKKKFNDMFELPKNLLNGNEWYCQQAFRALNQATGRCIRHRFDYGAIIFLDERFHRQRNRAYISKWLRKSIKLYSCFEDSLDSLKFFFQDVKERLGSAVNSSKEPHVDFETVKSVDKKKGTKMQNCKVTKSSRCQQNDACENANWSTHPPSPIVKHDSLSTHIRSEVIMIKDGKEESVTTQYLDLDSDSEKDLRWSERKDDLELTVVKETPDMDFRGPYTTPDFFSKDDYSSPITCDTFAVPPQLSSFHPRSFLNSHACHTSAIYSPFGTPQNEVVYEANSIPPDPESSWSVKSKVCKRRKVHDLASVTRQHEFRTPIEIPDKTSSLASSLTNADAAKEAEDIDYAGTPCRFKPFQSPKLISSDGSDMCSGADREVRLQLFCLICQSPLGCPEKEFCVMGSIISTSKVHLLSLKNRTLETGALVMTSVDVFVSDNSSVDQRLCEVAREGASEMGIWCKEDGCVFNSIFCPFCINQDNCLGVHIVATDASNKNLQSKILLYLDCLEVKNPEAEIKPSVTTKEKVLSPYFETRTVKKMDPHALDKFSYVSPVQSSGGGWRNTKSRVKREASTPTALFSTSGKF